MYREKALNLCEWATERVNAIVGGKDYWFKFNQYESRFEFWEQRGPIKQMVFPLTVGDKPLQDITDWEIKHAVNFVRRARQQRAQEQYFWNKEYEKYETYKNA